jgi:hypothetical protein
VLDQLIVVDYQEGAGGEFIASWLSAHYGHKLETDSQANPNYLQKWLNSYSLVYADWGENFANYLQTFIKECNSHGVSRLAVPYHLYKYPQHVEILRQHCNTRFVKINCDGYQKQVFDDFRRKVLHRVLQAQDFKEIKFLLRDQSKQKINYCMQLFKNNQLTYQDLLCGQPPNKLESLPSNDIEILYKDFFVDLDNTALACQKLCEQLQLHADARLLDALIERNKKNLQQQQAI